MASPPSSPSSPPPSLASASPTHYTTPPDVKLKRFLHYGREVPVFISGYHDFHDYIEMRSAHAVDVLFLDLPGDRQTEMINHIIKAAMDGYVVYPNCLSFALAKIITRADDRLRHAAYLALPTVCKTPKDLFEFVNFLALLGRAGCKGWGAGMRNAISRWYLNRDPMELAEIVSKYRGFVNWTHRDLLKLAHPKTQEPEKSVILKYVMKGIDEAKSGAPSDERTQEILLYLQRIEEFKHLSDPEIAANLISIYGYSVELVPQHNGLIKSQEVWLSLVRILPLSDILENMKRLSCYGFLKPKEPMEKILVERFQNEADITESNLHPFEVFLAIRKYEEHAKDQAIKMSAWVKAGRVSKVVKPAAKPNQMIIEAMNSLLNATFKLLVPTGMRYLLAVDLNMKNSQRVVGAPYVSPLQAAVLLIMTLMKAEKNVKVVTFPVQEGENVAAEGDAPPSEVIPEVMVPLDIDSNISVRANVDRVKQVNCGPAHVKQPLLWAKRENVPADVIIIISGTSLGEEYTSALVDYRKAMNLPNTKLIVHILSAMLFRSEESDTGVFHIGGFGAKVGKVIEAFSRGAF